MVNQYCAHSFTRNWQLPFLNQRNGILFLFLISPQKHTLWAFIKSVSPRCFKWVPTTCFCEKIRKLLCGYPLLSGAMPYVCLNPFTSGWILLKQRIYSHSGDILSFMSNTVDILSFMSNPSMWSEGNIISLGETTIPLKGTHQPLNISMKRKLHR